MKKFHTITIFVMLLLTTPFIPGLRAQDAYRTAMTAALGMLDNASGLQDHLMASSAFERIAVAEKEQWLPWYYTAFALIIPSLEEMDGEKKDQLLDRAQEAINRAMELAPEESEIYVLQAFLYPSRILVDPMARGMIYMDQMKVSLQRAMELNPDNPRIYFLEGVQKLNLPAAFGGGPDVARPILETSMEKYRLCEPVDSLLPSWGEDACLTELARLDSL